MQLLWVVHMLEISMLVRFINGIVDLQIQHCYNIVIWSKLVPQSGTCAINLLSTRLYNNINLTTAIESELHNIFTFGNVQYIYRARVHMHFPETDGNCALPSYSTVSTIPT